MLNLTEIYSLFKKNTYLNLSNAIFNFHNGEMVQTFFLRLISTCDRQKQIPTWMYSLRIDFLGA